MIVDDNGITVCDDGILLYFETFAEVFDMYGESVVWDYVEEIYVVLYEEEDEDDGETDEGYYSEDIEEEPEDSPEGW